MLRYRDISNILYLFIQALYHTLYGPWLESFTFQGALPRLLFSLASRPIIKNPAAQPSVWRYDDIKRSSQFTVGAV